MDPGFHRGATEFNRDGGDPGNTPNPSLRPLGKGPFYAVRIVPGSFGTFAGLYAAGSVRASVMGGHYPAGGINLGPALGVMPGRQRACPVRKLCGPAPESMRGKAPRTG